MYMAGPIIDAYNPGTGNAVTDWRQLSDTIISFTPNSKWAFALDGDYGFGPRDYGFSCSEAATSAKPRPQGVTPCAAIPAPAKNWWAVAGYAKYNFTPKSNLAVRYEYYGDPDGYSCLLSDCSFGHGQEVTTDYSYNLTKNLLVRGEYRYDFASQPSFERQPDSSPVKEQNTVTLGLIYSFASPAKE